MDMDMEVYMEVRTRERHVSDATSDFTRETRTRLALSPWPVETGMEATTRAGTARARAQ